jgi:hypothetical protein
MDGRDNARTRLLLAGTAMRRAGAWTVSKLLRREQRAATRCRNRKAVGKHGTSIFARLDPARSEGDNRRVLAVLACLNS